MARPELIERELSMTDAVPSPDLQVLVVDDSPVYRKLVEHALEGGPYSLLFAKSGREALELYARYLPGIVITDWMMPDLSGLDLCQRRGWQVGEVHTDDDRSAFSGKPRPGYAELLTRLQAGRVRGVVSWHPDRLHRSTKELEKFIDIIEACGAGVVTVQGGEYDLTTASGRMTARIVGAVARGESEHKRERIRAKMLQLQQTGKLTGAGRRPYGYEYIKTPEGKLDRLVVVESEATIIRELARRYMGGESLLSLVRDLNVRGIPAATGGAWGLASVSRLLRAKRLAGLRMVGREDAPAPWPAIITERTHKALTTLLTRNHLAGTRSQRRYLLTGGLVRCGSCGKAMIGRPIGGKMTYGCDKARGGCGSVWVRAERVDEVVAEAAFQVVDTPGLSKRLATTGEADRVLADIQAQELLLRDIAEDYTSRVLTRDEHHRLLKMANAKLDELRKSFQPEASLDYGQDNPLRLAWPTLPLGGRRAVLDAVIQAVRIMPVGHRAGVKFGQARFDSSRVLVDWKI